MPASTLRLALLGPPLIELDGVPIAVDTRKATALLAYLALTPHPVRRDSLAALLWPESDGERARAALRRTLSTAKAALGGAWLLAGRDDVALERDGVWIDVEEFDRRLAECADHGHPVTDTCPACVLPLERAIGLHRGELLAGFGLRDSISFDDWQFLEAERLRGRLAAALDRLADALAAQGDHERAIQHARRRLSLDVLHEPAHRRVIELYALAGHRSAALRQYRECVRILDRELGVAPLEETTQAYDAVREGTVKAAPVAPTTEAPAGPSRPKLLVGRSAEWKLLLETYAEVAASGRLVALTGEAGIGKSRLGEEFLGYVRAQGGIGIGVRSFRNEAGLPFGMLSELLRAALRNGDEAAVPAHALEEAARLLPELGRSPSAPLDTPGARTRFFEALTDLLFAATSSARPAAVFVDDAHWADDSSLEVVAYLIGRLHRRPLLLLISWRDEELPDSHAARHLLSELARVGMGHQLALSRLSRTDVVRLAEAAGATAEMGSRLYERTDGLPLFVAECLEAAAADASQEWPLPHGARGLLRARLAALSEVGRQIVSTAAAIGRSFELDLVQSASGRSDEEAVAAIEELTRAGLILERGDLGYDFSSELARTVSYDETSLARRRLLHRRIAAALLGTRAREARHAAVAQHLQAAGSDEEAAEHFRLAGEDARRLHANSEALSHFGAALALGHPDTAELHEAVGDLLILTGDYAQALTSYEKAAAEAPGSVARLEHKLGALHHRRGEWELAESQFEAALQAAGDPSLRARIELDRSLNDHRRGHGNALARARDALELARASGEAAALAQAHNVLGILLSSDGELDASKEHLERSLELAEQLADPGAGIAALNNLALAAARSDDLDRALSLAGRALDRCVKLGDRHREAAVRNNIADLLHASGRREEAMKELKAAVAIFAQIGGSPTERQAEIWKLTEW